MSFNQDIKKIFMYFLILIISLIGVIFVTFLLLKEDLSILESNLFTNIFLIYLMFIFLTITMTKDFDIFPRDNTSIKEAKRKIEQHPEKASPAWDLARSTLDAYFNRNLRHITAIFWLSVVVMVSGFSVIIWGVSQSIQTPNAVNPAWITVAAGVVTEFIGATFILIYRSTLTQALDYTKALERINSVGMAMQILDTMSDEATTDDLKSKTKAMLAELLIQNQKFMVSDRQNEEKK